MILGTYVSKRNLLVKVYYGPYYITAFFFEASVFEKVQIVGGIMVLIRDLTDTLSTLRC